MTLETHPYGHNLTMVKVVRNVAFWEGEMTKRVPLSGGLVVAVGVGRGPAFFWETPGCAQRSRVSPGACLEGEEGVAGTRPRPHTLRLAAEVLDLRKNYYRHQTGRSHFESLRLQSNTDVLRLPHLNTTKAFILLSVRNISEVLIAKIQWVFFDDFLAIPSKYLPKF